jgi:hypothetical protein
MVDDRDDRPASGSQSPAVARDGVILDVGGRALGTAGLAVTRDA